MELTLQTSISSYVVCDVEAWGLGQELEGGRSLTLKIIPRDGGDIMLLTFSLQDSLDLFVSVIAKMKEGKGVTND